MYDQWLWMIFHVPANPTIDLGGIPANQETFRRAFGSFPLIDKVDCQERYISMTLNLGIDHVVPWTEASFSSSAPAATASRPAHRPAFP